MHVLWPILVTLYVSTIASLIYAGISGANWPILFAMVTGPAAIILHVGNALRGDRLDPEA